MTAALQTPSAERVKAACEQFDREHELIEHALQELFREHPHNSDLRHVLLKVVAVNSLCHTHLFALDAVARHIQANIQDIDTGLAAGSPEIVNKIARIAIQGKQYNFYSFATKYCNWHNPEAYPVYDLRVDHYLSTLQKQRPFAAFHHAELCDYPRFREILTEFRSFHKLGSFNFKEIGKFLHLQGEPAAVAVPDLLPPGVGAFDFYPAEELTS